MRPLRLLAFVLALAPSLAAQNTDWGKLLDQNKVAEATTLCTLESHSADVARRVDAEKCLANIALCGAEQLTLTGNGTGGGSLGTGYNPAAVDRAISHLDKGLKLAPQDLSLHQGRLHVLEVSGRFPQMVAALDDSATVYKGGDALPSWLAYDAELANMGQIKAGLAFAEVLNRHYPDSHDVIGNLGAFHSMLKQPGAALPYLRRAVKLAPDDPLDTWNLGWALKLLNQTAEADKWMSRSLELKPAGRDDEDRGCLYADFVQTSLHDVARACKLQQASCQPERQAACKAAKGE